MNKSQSSITAQGIASIRALEFERPAAQRICDDPLARKFVSPAYYLLSKLFAGYAERKGPGVIGFLVVRCRYMDDCLKESLAAGLTQVVILGAGLDSRAYRIEGLKSGVRVFEVDQSATQVSKIKQVKRIFGAPPAHVTYVPVDFNTEDLRKLLAHGYDPEKRTMFLWEGVTYYLTADAVDQTLAFVAGNAAPGSEIVFDYMNPSALTERKKRAEIVRMERAKRFTDERLVFGIDPGQIGEFLRRRGFERIVNLTAEDLHARYFTGANRSRPVAPVYAIVRAAIPNK